ncbi:MAG: hypothetical protein ACE5HP_02490 [Gemmatimonadota bacterium]
MTNLFHGDIVPPAREPTGKRRWAESDAETVLVGTAAAVPVRVEEIPHHLAPDGTLCVGCFVNDRLVARCAIPREAAQEFLGLDLFRQPVALALGARAGGPLVEGNLLALVPASEAQEAEPGEEPWKESVPGSGFEAAAGIQERGDEGQLVGIFLGQVVRFQEDRRFPDNLVREAADMLAGIVRGRVGNVVDRVIQDLGGP